MNTMRLWPDGPLYAEAKHMPITTDSILLADFAAVHRGEKGADLGCASGLLMLMLLWEEKELHMTGLELLPEAVQLAEENLRANGLQERAELVCGDLRETAGKLPNGGFDFIIGRSAQRRKRGEDSPSPGTLPGCLAALPQRGTGILLLPCGAACFAPAGDAGAASGAKEDPLCPARCCFSCVAAAHRRTQGWKTRTPCGAGIPDPRRGRERDRRIRTNMPSGMNTEKRILLRIQVRKDEPYSPGDQDSSSSSSSSPSFSLRRLPTRLLSAMLSS